MKETNKAGLNARNASVWSVRFAMTMSGVFLFQKNRKSTLQNRLFIYYSNLFFWDSYS